MTEITPYTISDIVGGDKDAFERAFREYYTPLMNLAQGLVKDHAIADEQVQEVFIKLWERRHLISAEVKLFPYLFTSIRNRCYNYLRDQKVARKHLDAVRQEYQDLILVDYNIEDLGDEVIEDLYKAIAQLPDKCQEVFKMSRFEQLTHKQIAEKLSISTKTIENHITKALKILKRTLAGKVIILVLILGESLLAGVFT